MNKIPIALIFYRFLIGFVIIYLAYIEVLHYKIYAITFLSIGLLTDIFDGIIARRLKISTQRLRRLDSTIDQVFFISVAVATFIECPQFFRSHTTMLTVLLSLEALTYMISFLRFKKEIATHSVGAKVWTLLLFTTLIEVIATCDSTLIFYVCFWVGIITRLEIIAIILTLRIWTNDVPSIYHALQLRAGKPIRRHKLFNG